MLRRDGDGYAVDWDKLAATVRKAVHFLDNVIEANKYPLEQIDFTTKQTRKVGLGVMGWADMLLRLGIAYNSEEAVSLADRLMEFITSAGRAASAALAESRGAFPLFAESIYKDGKPCATPPSPPSPPPAPCPSSRGVLRRRAGLCLCLHPHGDGRAPTWWRSTPF